MRTLIIHNVDAGFGSDAVFEFQRALLKAGDECTLRVVGDGFDPVDVTKDAESYKVVVLSGGDGTVAALLDAMKGRNVRTCVFPSGTANLIFSNLGSAPEPAAIARSCRIGHTVRTDLGSVTWTTPDGQTQQRGFSLMTGSGFDAEIMRAAIPNKHSMGQAAYFLAAVSDPTPKMVHFTIELDNETVERDGIACIVANNARMQADIEIIPNCRMDDGLLDIIVLEADATAKLLSPILAGLIDKTGRGLTRPHIESFKSRHVRITPATPIPMQVDGDPVAKLISSYEASVLPGVNRLIVDCVARYEATDIECDPLVDDGPRPAFPV